MKIIIIGAGISGLSTYLFLRKHLSSLSDQQHEIEIKIYEAYDVRRYIGKSCTPTLKSGNGSSGAAEREGSNDDGNITATSISASEAEAAAKVEAEAEAQKSFTPEALGNAIGISRNGLNVLSRLFTSEDDKTAGGEPKGGFSEVLEDMIREGHPATKWRMSCARGWVLSDVSMLPKSMAKDQKEKRMTSSSASTSEAEEQKTRGSWDDSPINLIMISRQVFWAILLKHLVKQAGADAIQHKKVEELFIPPANSMTRTIVKFTDGTEDSADLVIGADGLRSVVRKAMFQTHPSSDTFTNAPEMKKTGLLSWLLSLFSSHTKTKTKDYITPHYEGLVGLGSFIPSSLLSSTGVEPGTMSIVFGPNGFFGYGYITSSPPYPDPLSETNATPGPVAVFWSTFASETESPFPVSLPTSYGNDGGDDEGCKRRGPRPSPYQFNKFLALSSLLSRHRSWKIPTITAILQHLEQSGPQNLDGFYPTYTTPELPTWQKNGKLVLVGDAAHALQPSSGQGACQALEDAEGLGLLLQYYLRESQRNSEANATPVTPASTAKAISLALKSFDTLRIPRLHKIYVHSQRMSGMKADMGFVAEGCMYAAIWIVSKLGMGPGGKALEELVGYDLVGDVERVVRQDQWR